MNSASEPRVTWATGPNGTMSYGAAKNPSKLPNEQSQEPMEPAALYAKSPLVTVDDVVAFGSGPGTEALQGVADSTIIFTILRDEL